jgi:hypothetical protein
MAIPIAIETKVETKTMDTKAIHRAATNEPTLSDNEFTLGERVFKVVDLEYDAYLKFITKLAPLMKAIAGGLMASRGASMSSAIDPAALVEHCVNELPDLAALVCQQTDPSVTPADVKKWAKTPFKLATIILRQIEQNKIISEISDFFAQMLPLMKVAMNLKK